MSFGGQRVCGTVISLENPYLVQGAICHPVSPCLVSLSNAPSRLAARLRYRTSEKQHAQDSDHFHVKSIQCVLGKLPWLPKGDSHVAPDSNVLFCVNFCLINPYAAGG